MTKPLGDAKRTGRGFQYVEFKDHYGESCVLQQSSLAIFVQPGTSAVWLGIEGSRMHLTLEQVESLVAHLQAWIDNDGDLTVEEDT